MITRNHYFMLKRHYLEVFNEIEKMLLSTIVGEITRMNEKISLNIIIKNPLELLGR